MDLLKSEMYGKNYITFTKNSDIQLVWCEDKQVTESLLEYPVTDINHTNQTN